MTGFLEIHDPLAPAAKRNPIGIDLGTTFSLVAAVKCARPYTIVGPDKSALLPSIVYYGPEGVEVGARAKSHAAERPRNTIAGVKRFMGKGADDAETHRLLPYVFDRNDPKVVRFRVGAGRTVTPVEVSAEILRELKRRAETHFAEQPDLASSEVGGAVLTVPAYFDDAQRQATKDAGRLAGLDVLRLINEPTAAALAYGLDQKKNGTFAVYDLGGGTFDITILTLEDGLFQVKSTGGDSALGGDDFDRALANLLLGEAGVRKPSSEQVRATIDAATRIKHALTDADEAEVGLPGMRRTVTREELEALIRPIVDKTSVVCRRALKDAGIAGQALDGVILVGGSTRVPLVRRYVRDLFGQEPLADIDPEQVVALGAAIQADLLAGAGPRDDVLLLDVLPLSLGIETMGGVVEKIIPRNSTIPTAAAQVFTTYADNQTAFDIHVLQGERELVQDCRSLARFELKGIPPLPAGLARLEVKFVVDADGLLGVTAREQKTGIEQSIAVKPSYGLTDEQIEKMLVDSIEHAEEDVRERLLRLARVEADQVLRATAKALDIDGDLLESAERARIEAAMQALARLREGTDPGAINAAGLALDATTAAFAGRRMNRSIARALEGHSADEIDARLGSGA